MASPCVVQLCKNIGNHRFPQNETRSKIWIDAIKHVKPGLTIRKNSFICSAHFKSEDFISNPNLTTLARFPRARSLRILKKTAIPSLFPWNTGTETCGLQNQVPQQLEHDSSEFPIFSPTTSIGVTYSRTPPIAFVEIPQSQYSEEAVGKEDPLYIPETYESEITVPIDLVDQEMETNSVEQSCSPCPAENENVMFTFTAGKISVQTQMPEDSAPQGPHSLSIQTQTHDLNTKTGLSIYYYKDDDKRLHFYTGLEKFEKFMFVFCSLGNDVDNIKYFYGPPPERIDALEQFFITLIILRRHLTFEDISNLFKISLKNVYSILITWVRFMALQWRNLDLWVERENVQANSPNDFFDKYPGTRVIIDATECPIKKPKLPLAQQVTFSSYKNKNTIKFMVGITPGGFISYVSPAYGGSATDRQIIERSTLIQKFNYNDEIMVDKGINVQDILAPHGVKVNMPAFFKKGNQISPETLSTNRKVASKRVHVERIIGMIKTYKILTEPMNQTEILLSSDIVFIIAMLVNFRSNIMIKKT